MKEIRGGPVSIKLAPENAILLDYPIRKATPVPFCSRSSWRFTFMLRLIMRSVGLMILFFLLVPAGFSKSPARGADKDIKQADDTAAAPASADATTAPDAAK